MNVFELMGTIELRDEGFRQGINNAQRSIRQLQAVFNSSTSALDRSVQQSMTAAGRSANRGARQVGRASDDMTEALDEVGESMDTAAESADENFERIGNAAEESGDQVANSSQEARQGVEDSTNQLSASVIAKAQLMAQAIAGAIKMAANGAKQLVSSALEGYGNYQQLSGGIQKLYGNMGQGLLDYASANGQTVDEAKAQWQTLEKAQNTMIRNAKAGWQTAGMSANDYMQNVTGFSAALINSLGGDTLKAANVADMAMQDISDNVNTFGTYTVQELADVYKALARGNYMTLDNLNLGFAGTKEGAQQLIDKANELAKAQGEAGDLTLDSFSDVLKAIHLVQDDLHITGTTSREAMSILEGSINMTKAAWQNFIAGLGDKDANISELTENLVASAGTALGNLKPVIEQTLSVMGNVLLEEGPKLITKLADGISSGIPGAIPKVIEVVQRIGEKFGEHTDELKNAGKKLLEGLLTGISEATGIDIDVSAITAVFGKIGELGGGALDTVVGLFQKAGPPVAAFVGSLIDLGSTIAGSVLTAFENLAPIVESIVGAFIDFGSTVISAVSPAIQGLSNFLSEHGEIIEAVVAAVAAVVGGFMALEGIITVLITVVDAISVAVGVFNAVLNANPIMLIVTAIAALVAAIIYLWNNSEEFRNFVIGLWETISSAVVAAVTAIGDFLKSAWEGIKNVASTVWNAISSTITGIVNGIASGLSAAWNGIQNVVSTVFNAIKSVVTTVWNGISTAISTVVTTIQNVISTGFNAVKTAVSTVFNAVKTAITKPFKAAYDTVKGIVNKLKNIFNFSWKLPDIQIPKFKIQGGTFPYGLGGKGKFPQIDIEWHAKAMNAPMLLTKPTIFGMMGDKYLAGGEAGPEVVSGVNPLLNMMRNAASSGNGRRDAMLSMIVALLSQYLPDISTGQDPEALFQAFDRRLGEAMI